MNRVLAAVFAAGVREIEQVPLEGRPMSNGEVPRMKLSVRITNDQRGGYTAVCPSLPGCVCRGKTREEATSRLDEAIRGYIAAISNFIPETLIHEVVEV